ncbi:MAG: MBL fold metallo-hydrolase [Haloglomus sp.]
MSQISPNAVSERLERDDEDMLLLDIRPADGFEEWHIPGSEHIDVYDELRSDPRSAADALSVLPRDKEIVTVCGVGKVSATATAVLREMGYDARTLTDGMHGWTRVHRTAEVPLDSVQVIQVARPGTGCLSYVLISNGEALVVDPSQYVEEYEDILDERGATATAVVETHAHADHVSGARDLATKHDVPHYLHPADADALAQTTGIDDGTELGPGPVRIEVVHTPGHTEGSVTLDVAGEALLTGDTLFLDSVGRPDLEAGNREEITARAGTLYESLKRLLDRPADALVLPAHDSGSPDPPMTAPLADVREQNELLGHSRATFVDAITQDIPDTPSNHERIKRANVGQLELDETDARQLELGPNQCAAE